MPRKARSGRDLNKRKLQTIINAINRENDKALSIALYYEDIKPEWAGQVVASLQGLEMTISLLEQLEKTL